MLETNRNRNIETHKSSALAGHGGAHLSVVAPTGRQPQYWLSGAKCVEATYVFSCLDVCWLEDRNIFASKQAFILFWGGTCHQQYRSSQQESACPVAEEDGDQRSQENRDVDGPICGTSKPRPKKIAIIS